MDNPAVDTTTPLDTAEQHFLYANDPIASDTDYNIYKFACLFGLALISSQSCSFVATYTSSLDRRVKYMEVVIPLEAKAGRTKVDDEVLALRKKLIEVSQAKVASNCLATVLVTGIALSVLGALEWHGKIQRRDDKLTELLKLRAEVASSSISVGTGGESASKDG